MLFLCRAMSIVALDKTRETKLELVAHISKSTLVRLPRLERFLLFHELDLPLRRVGEVNRKLSVTVTPRAIMPMASSCASPPIDLILLLFQ